jgi:hypothetical protein
MPTAPLNLPALEAVTAGQAGYVTDQGVRCWTGKKIPAHSAVVIALQDVGAGEVGRFQERPRPGDAVVLARADEQYDVLRIANDLKLEKQREGLTFKAASQAAREVSQSRRWLSRHQQPDVYERF